jgi:hypothetical protein
MTGIQFKSYFKTQYNFTGLLSDSTMAADFSDQIYEGTFTIGYGSMTLIGYQYYDP